MKKYTKIKKCLLSNKKIYKIIDLGMHSFADTFIKKNQLRIDEPKFPLNCYMCKISGHIQLGIITDDKQRYNLYSYSYTSSNSNFSKNHWKNFYYNISKKFNIQNKKILEIGSNDGYLLNFFQKNNSVLGLDASKEMCIYSKKKYNLNTINDVFSNKSIKKVKRISSKFDLILANNVLNHSNNPLNFVKTVKKLLDKKGIFIFEVPYWADGVKKNKIDQIYHEHISYFTYKSIRYLIKKTKLKLIDVQKINYHGGSLRVVLGFEENKYRNNFLSKKILEETKSKLFLLKTYRSLDSKLKWQRKMLTKKILKIKSKGYKIIGVGAAAKANTWLVYNKIDNQKFDYITDSSKFKIGKYTPLTRIQIKSDSILKKYNKVYVKILSWNISNLLKDKLKKINSKIKFI